jgi:hypothetical protein
VPVLRHFFFGDCDCRLATGSELTAVPDAMVAASEW